MDNMKLTSLYFSEILLISFTGLILYFIDAPMVINTIIYILLLTEVIWCLRFLYTNCHDKSNKLANTSFVIFVCGCIIIRIYQYFNEIPNIISTALVLMLTFALGYSIFIKSKLNKNNSNSFMLKIFGFIFVAISSVGSILVLFGIAR